MASAQRGEAVIVSVHTEAHIAETAELARDIWLPHYVPMIGRPQVEYMLERFQSVAAITAQIGASTEYSLLHVQDQAVGYVAITPDPASECLLLSKLYVHADWRGQGYGKQLLEHVVARARAGGMHRIWLTVNRHNRDSIAWYEHAGFRNTGPTMLDIGNGFVMDDYRMERDIAQGGHPV